MEGRGYALDKDKEEIVKEILKNSGFKIKKEVYRNFDTVDGEYRLRSLIYLGKYGGVEAILKVHGAKNAADDAREIRNFENQNKSETIRAPKVYRYQRWKDNAGYGFTIFEYIDAAEITSRPFPTAEQLRDFARFYQEYKTKAVTKPWKKPDGRCTTLSILKSVDAWYENAEAKKRLKFEDYAPYVIRFYSLALKYAESIPTEFMHMHLYPEHIRKQSDGRYVILDHMSWGWRLQWADLSYMVWRTMLDIRDNKYSFGQLLDYVNRWVSAFERIPLVRKDRDFEKKLTFLLLERSIGIILGDLGSGRFWGTPRGKKYFKHKLYLQQRLFDHLADRLEGKWQMAHT